MAVRDSNDELTLALAREAVPNEREVTWLWIFLISKGAPLDPNLYGSYAGRSQMASFLKSSLYIREQAKALMERLLPAPSLSWITQENRQITWLLSALSRNAPMLNLPPQLAGREQAIAAIDAWEIPPTEKLAKLRHIEHQWNMIRQRDKLFTWFKEKDRATRCSAAWEWLCRNKSYSTLGKAPFEGYDDLISFFDQSNWDEATKDLCVIKIKRYWSQTNYRKKLQGKKQYNFVLTDTVNQKLNQLAARHGLKRNQILEILIETEAAQDLYIPGHPNFLGSRL